MKMDLGQETEHYPGAVPVFPSEAPKKHYPSFTYVGKEELDLPEEGEMTIEFRKRRSADSKDHKDEKTYECTIEVLKITSVDGEGADDEADAPTPPASNKGAEATSALDALMAAHMKAKGK